MPIRRRTAIAATALVLLVLAGTYAALHGSGMLDAILDGATLRARIARLGAWGPSAVVALMILAVLVSPIPSAPIAMAAGAVYGHTWGTLYVIVGAEAGALAAFGIARLLGRAALERWLGQGLSAGLVGSQNVLMGVVFTSRLMPFVSFDLVSYAAGLTVLTAGRFALATLAGIIPASFLLAHFGSELAADGGNGLAYTTLALGVVMLAPVAIKLWRDHRRGGPD